MGVIANFAKRHAAKKADEQNRMNEAQTLLNELKGECLTVDDVADPDAPVTADADKPEVLGIDMASGTDTTVVTRLNGESDVIKANIEPGEADPKDAATMIVDTAIAVDELNSSADQARQAAGAIDSAACAIDTAADEARSAASEIDRAADEAASASQEISEAADELKKPSASSVTQPEPSAKKQKKPARATTSRSSAGKKGTKPKSSSKE